jgi:16S rRNA processing protein RimM
MDKSDCLLLGSISKLFSFKGEVVLYIDHRRPQDFGDLDCIFLEINDTLVPFFVDKISFHKKNLYRVRFEGIDDEDAAKRILKKSVYLPLDEVPEPPSDSFELFDTIGFKLYDQNDKLIGEITDFNDSEVNPLVEVKLAGSEALVPINERTIIEIVIKEKKVKLEIPEGLIDLYL